MYIVLCSDDSIYTGITNNVARRLEEHNYGKNCNAYTFSRRPVKLLFCQEFMQFQQAEQFEKQIKRWSRKKKLALALNDFDQLQQLSQCRNSSHYRKK